MLGATLWSPSVAGTRELFLGCRKSLWDKKKFAKADVHRCSAVCSGLGSVESTVAKLKQESRGRKLAHTLLRFLCPVTSPRSAWIYVPNSQPPPDPRPIPPVRGSSTRHSEPRWLQLATTWEWQEQSLTICLFPESSSISTLCYR